MIHNYQNTKYREQRKDIKSCRRKTQSHINRQANYNNTQFLNRVDESQKDMDQCSTSSEKPSMPAQTTIDNNTINNN